MNSNDSSTPAKGPSATDRLVHRPSMLGAAFAIQQTVKVGTVAARLVLPAVGVPSHDELAKTTRVKDPVPLVFEGPRVMVTSAFTAMPFFPPSGGAR